MRMGEHVIIAKVSGYPDIYLSVFCDTRGLKPWQADIKKALCFAEKKDADRCAALIAKGELVEHGKNLLFLALKMFDLEGKSQVAITFCVAEIIPGLKFFGNDCVSILNYDEEIEWSIAELHIPEIEKEY